jgi:hypothetical protein
MRTWIFQGNPDDFDIDGYLAARPAELLWLVTRYANEIAVGDRVYLWRNQGTSGAVAGVVAEGIVTAPPALRDEDPDSVEFWLNQGERSSSPQVRAGMRSSRLRAHEKCSGASGASTIRYFGTCQTCECKRGRTIPSPTSRPFD